jgi:adenylate cyclase
MVSPSVTLAYADYRFNRAFDIKSGFRTRSILCTPMINAEGEIIGVFQAINKLTDPSVFVAEDVQQITSFSSVAASTIQKSLEFKKLQTDLRDTSMSRMYMSSILQTMPSCIMTINKDGRLVLPSKSAIN